MTEAEFTQKFAALEAAHDKLSKKMDAINFEDNNGEDSEKDFEKLDEFSELVDKMSDSIDKMIGLLDEFSAQNGES